MVDVGTAWTCPSCGEPLVWARDERMRRIRVSAAPDELAGDRVVFRDGDGHLCAYYPQNVSATERPARFDLHATHYGCRIPA